MRYPALPLCLALLAGASFGLFVAPAADVLAGLAVLGFAVAAVSFSQQERGLCAVATIVTTAICGITLAGLEQARALHPPLRETLTRVRGPGAVSDSVSDPVHLDLVLTSDASSDADGTRLDGEVRAIAADGIRVETRGGVVVSAPAGSDPAGERAWTKGRRVRLPALLRRQSRYLNPGVPDHEAASLRRGVAMVGIVKSSRLVEVVAIGSAAAETAAAARSFARAALDRHVGRHSPRSAAIARAIVVGDRSGLDDEVEERLQAAGTYHVLAISGGNIAILAGVVLGLLRLAAVRSPVAELVAIAVLVAYAWVVGGGASVNRATCMAVAMLASRAIDHRSRPANAIALAGGATLAVHPLALFEPGAWLTYGATAAIVLAAAWSGAWLAARRWWLGWPLALLVASLAAEAALFPVAAYAFSRVTMAGLLVNFAAIPAMTVVQIAAMVTVAASGLCESVAHVAGRVAHLAAAVLVESGRLVDVAPWMARRLPAPHVAWMCVYYTAAVGALVAVASLRRCGPTSAIRACETRRPGVRRCLCVLSAGFGVTALAAAWVIVAAPVWPGTLPATGVRVTFIDVGQGDAALVQTAGGFSMLVDAGGAGGGRFDIGGRVVAPVLWAQGVRRLDVLVVTHGDADHISGAAVIVREFRPREVWEGVPVTTHEPLAAVRAAAVSAGAVWRTVQRGDEAVIDGATIRALHPPLADWERQRVRNDDSVAIEVRCDDVSIVMPGDIEAAAEQSVGPLLGPAGLRLLQAPHHGSASSSTAALVSASNARVGVVSAGRGNRYGHPHAAVLQRLAATGTAVFGTDRDGAIVASTDGRSLRIETFTGTRAWYPVASGARAR